MGISREGWGLCDGTPTNKKKHQQTRKKHQQTRKKHQQTRKNTNKQEKHQQTRETPFEQGKRLSINKKNTFQARKRLSSKGYLPIKCKSLQVVGVSGQGKAVVSDGGYILFIGMGRCGGNQGKREAAMAWGRSRWSSVPVSLWR